MNNPFLFFGLLFAVLFNAYNQPTDNPIASFYNGAEGYPGWTDQINWLNVIDMSSYSVGTNDFEKFENARDELSSQGGGVLYYPAGTYYFDVIKGPAGRGLMLKTGVVIRGETPSSDISAVTDSNHLHGLSNLPTKFVFSYRNTGDGEVPWMWNLIGITPSPGETLDQVNLTGIAWMNIEGAVIYMGANMEWDSTWDQDQSYRPAINDWKGRVPDGTHPLDPIGGVTKNNPYADPPVSHFRRSGEKLFVFGCKFDNSTMSNWGLDDYSKGGLDTATFYYGGYRHGQRIGMFGSHLFIANNVISKPTKCFYYDQLTVDRKSGEQPAVNTVMFDYGKCGGLVVNKDLITGLIQRCNLDSGAFYQDDIIIRDNWVYNHGNEGFAVAGKWVVIKNNRNYRDYLDESGACYGLPGSYELTLSGYWESTPIDDNQSRAMDLGGMNLWVDSNWYTGTGSTPGNDGEGILCQRFGSFEVFSWAMTHNSQGSTGESGYIAPYDVHVLGMLTAWNDQRGSVGILKTVSNEGQDISVVDNVASQVVGGGGTNIKDFLDVCPTGAPAKPINVTVNNLVYGNEINWTDIASNEIGFRIDRKIDSGNWYTIAYRPRNETGSVWDYPGLEYDGAQICTNQPTRDYNEQKWIDFTAPNGRMITYRVSAINCNDDETGSAEPVIATPEIVSDLNDWKRITIYPTLASDNLHIKNAGGKDFELISVSGLFLYQSEIDSDYYSLDINGLTNGFYLIRIEGSIYKFIVYK
jgi:hypothetical protein